MNNEELVQKAFEFWDGDNNGKIDKDEWFTRMKQFEAIDESELNELWDEFDIDGNGVLDEDKDANGTLTKDEMLPWIKEFAKMGGADPESEEVKHMATQMERIMAAHVGIGGEVDYKAFYEVMRLFIKA